MPQTRITHNSRSIASYSITTFSYALALDRTVSVDPRTGRTAWVHSSHTYGFAPSSNQATGGVIVVSYGAIPVDLLFYPDDIRVKAHCLASSSQQRNVVELMQ